MVYIYILAMALVTYLIRLIPLVLVRGKIENVFLKNLLHYLPPACLSAMTFPAILYATNSIFSALAGFVVAIVLSIFNRSLIVVAIAACAAVFVVELLPIS